MATVTVIPQKLNKITKMPINSKAKLRVVAYARVSTDSDEQFTSFEAQVDYYENYIKSRCDWEYAGIYTDEGISGTNTKKREGFNKMIEDGLAGKFDLLVTKSVSRFARNTVDSLTTIRKLKDKNVGCYFEKENINTLDNAGGELLITIMSSFAQEESRSISENVTWGCRKRFSDGKVSVGYKNFLGYEKGPDGRPKVVPAQAEVVRKIYRLFIEGLTPSAITKRLMDEGIKTPGGKDKWQISTVKSILTNEKYKGDALLQKSYTVDFLQKKIKKNNGEIQQYYVEGSHEAIIEPIEWDIVQAEMERRESLGANYTNRALFSSKLKCECCGGLYGQKTWHSTDAYKMLIWQCNNKFKKDKPKCTTPNLREAEIKKAFVDAYNKLISNKNNIIKDCKLMRDLVSDTTELNKQLEAQQKEVDMVKEHADLLVKANATSKQNQDKYQKKYGELKSRFDDELEKLNKIQEAINNKLDKGKQIDIFIKKLQYLNEPAEEWNESIWNLLVESAVVHIDKTITFKFYGGHEITI